MVFTPRFYLALALAILLALASVLHAPLGLASLCLTGLLLGISLLDILLTPRQPLEAVRHHAAGMMLGHPANIRLDVYNRADRAFRFWIRDMPPLPFTCIREPLPLFLNAHASSLLNYTISSTQRGEFEFGDLYYRISGPLGLIERQEKITLPAKVYVFPDFSTSGARDLALASHAMVSVGRRPHLAPGEGHVFESLRDYQRDDDFRNIEWKATARRGKLISRTFQMEQDQRMVIMIDLGRLMSPKIGGFRKLDYAVNAGVRLAQTALTQGDLVGLLLFSHEIAYYLPPRKGQAQLTKIVSALVNAQPRRLESNYHLAFNYAARQNSRRTLFICFTDLADLAVSRVLVESIAKLQPRHLAMTVTMSDSDVLALRRKIPETELDVYRHIAAQEVWEDYQRTIRALETRKILSVNVPAESLTLATINRYLHIKQMARL